ncbi:unnamed protein product [Natator depressus]
MGGAGLVGGKKSPRLTCSTLLGAAGKSLQNGVEILHVPIPALVQGARTPGFCSQFCCPL